MSEIGKRIRTQREKLNLTQEELASRLGYKSKTTIAKIENGTNDIVQSKVLAFAQALNTTPAYLMGWTPYDSHFSGKEAPEEIRNRFTQNVLKFHGSEQVLMDNYRQLSDLNKKKVVDYSDSLLKVQKIEEDQRRLIPVAAHERTDTGTSPDGRQHDPDIIIANEAT